MEEISKIRGTKKHRRQNALAFLVLKHQSSKKGNEQMSVLYRRRNVLINIKHSTELLRSLIIHLKEKYSQLFILENNVFNSFRSIRNITRSYLLEDDRVN